MRVRQCPNEAAVLQALRGGGLEGELLSHTTDCSVCGEVVQVASWLNRLSELTESDEPLPDPTQIWWKARIIRDLQRRSEPDEQATRPLVWTQILTVATVFSGGVIWWLLRGVSLHRYLADLGSSLSEGGIVLGLSPSWTLVLTLGLGLPLLTLLASLGLLWRDD